MAVIKVYTRINWLNKSESLTTPLGKTNLNKMDKAIDTIDNEVVSISVATESLDTTKADKDQLNNMVTDISFNDKNGVISITKYDNTVLNIDTAMEKIAVNFEYNAQTQQLILTLESGEKQYIDMSALITQYEFKDTDTIAFSVDSDGKVSASIKSGSITKAMLSSEVMSAITLSENNAAASAQAAAQSATNADMDAKLAQSYSIGKSGIRDGEETDNSKYYCEQSKKYAEQAHEIVGEDFIPKSEKGVANGVAVLNTNLAVEKAVADEDGDNIKDTYATTTALNNKIDKIGGAIASCGGNGTYTYFKIATIKIKSGYINSPIGFELSGRGKKISLLTVIFSSTNTSDPTLNTFCSNEENSFYIKKTATSTWEIYGQYNEPWGGYVLHRITGAALTSTAISVQVDMTNISSLPSECTQATYTGNVAYALNSAKVNNHTVNSDVPANAKFTDTTYSVATTSANGLMSSSDKSKLDNLNVPNEILGTLSAGQTELTLSSEKISAESTIDIYTDVYGVSPKTATVADGSITMTFKAQKADVNVKVVVK